MAQAFVDQFTNLELGLPESVKEAGSSKKIPTPFYIRLISPPFPFSATDFEFLKQQVQEDKKGCDWEIIPHVSHRDDSYLGQINLGTVDGHDQSVDEFLYSRENSAKTKEKYTIFRAVNKVMQPFKNLYYRPAKVQEINLKMESLEFLPFQAGMGFLSIAFSSLSDGNIPFRFAIDANYYLPFLGSRAVPLIQKKCLKNGPVEKKEYYIPSLFECAWRSVLGKSDENGISVKIADSQRLRIDKPEIVGNKSRLFFMSYAISSVEDKDWQTQKMEAARHYYHQVTRWSKDNYVHDIGPVIRREGPEKTISGVSTRSCAFIQDGITCIGLGASEFERNNYLPKFRKSYYFALLLAWHIKTGLQMTEPSKNWLEAVKTFQFDSFFIKVPRQQFFQDCLEFFQVGSPCDVKEKVQKYRGEHNDEARVIDRDECIFHNKGKIWEIVYEGEKVHLPNSKGFQHIAYLLLHANKKIPVIELYHHGKLLPKPKSSFSSQDAYNEDVNYTESYEEISCGFKKVGEYKKIFEDLKNEREEAEENHDMATLERVDREIQKFENEIKKSQRSPQFKKSGDEEKARKTVHAALKRAYKEIGEEHESLALHLKNSIKTGFYCRYQPEKEIYWDCQP